MKLFAGDIAIDLGSANTLVYVKDKGVVVNQPSVIAVGLGEANTEKILAVGEEASSMAGRTPGSIQVVRPIQDGVIVNIDAACAMLKRFIRSTGRAFSFGRPRMLICVPASITEIEKRAVVDSAKAAGAGRVDLLEGTIAAALGADLPVTEPVCNMVVDIGGGTTDVAVISLAGLVSSRSSKTAGARMDAAIQRYIQQSYNLLIGIESAEFLKTTIGNADPGSEPPVTIEVKGRDLTTGIPRSQSIQSEEIHTAISESLADILRTIIATLEDIPPELSADIIERGILLTGGGALLQNLDKWLSEQIGLPLSIPEDPLSTVIRGAARVLNSSNGLARFIFR
jgi:rod shape-determining protein MreB